MYALEHLYFAEAQLTPPQDYEEHHTDTTVHFKIHMTDKDMRSAEVEGLEKRFKINTTISTSNMVCFDLNGKIRKYTSAEEILSDFYHKRLEFYGLRKVGAAPRSRFQLTTHSNTLRTSSTDSSRSCRTKLALSR
jgi:DNA topoisomerase-2